MCSLLITVSLFYQSANKIKKKKKRKKEIKKKTENSRSASLHKFIFIKKK